MKAIKKNGKGMWTLSALCVAALITASGCDFENADGHSAMAAAANPSSAMARLFIPSPAFEVRLETVTDSSPTNEDSQSTN